MPDLHIEPRLIKIHQTDCFVQNEFIERINGNDAARAADRRPRMKIIEVQLPSP